MTVSIRRFETPSLIGSIENIRLLSNREKFSFISKLCFFIENGFLYKENEEIREHLKYLTTDVNQEVRVFIAEQLKHSINLPHEIAISLAHDISTVAIPIILYSPQLTDADLIDLLSETQEVNKLIAISNRNHLGEEVTLRIYSMKDYNMMLNVIKNPTNKINIELHGLLLKSYHYDQLLIKTLLSRDGLDKSSLQKLINELDPKAKKNMSRYLDLYVDEVKDKFCPTNLTSFEDYPSSEHELMLRRKIDQLYSNNNLNHAIVVFYLCKGDLYSFLYSISKHSEIPFGQVKFIVTQHINTTEFEKLYYNAGLPINFMYAIQKIISVLITNLQKGENITIQNFPILLRKYLKEHLRNRDIEGLGYLMKLITRRE